MKLSFILPVLFLFLVGCNGMSEPNEQFMVSSIGFVKTGAKVSAFVQAVDVKGGEQNENPETFVVKGEGNSVGNAVKNTRSKLSKKLSLKHTELILINDTLEKDDLAEILSLSEDFDVSLRAKIASCEDIEKLLKNNSASSGLGLASVIEQNAASAGFGGHTDLFEIKTAFLLGEEFAVTYFSSGEEVGVEGLYYYKNGIPTDILNFEESIRYSKEKNLYEGE